jgi:hypothetical protein
MMIPPATFIQKRGMNSTKTDPISSIIAVEIVNATDPAAKTRQGFAFVARVSSRIASLSVSSATNIEPKTVRNGTKSSAGATSGSHLVTSVGEEDEFAIAGDAKRSTSLLERPIFDKDLIIIAQNRH